MFFTDLIIERFKCNTFKSASTQNAFNVANTGGEKC